MPREGLAPSRVIHPLDFKSRPSANSGTRAISCLSFFHWLPTISYRPTEATVGIAPTYTSFAEKRLSYLATWPFFQEYLTLGITHCSHTGNLSLNNGSKPDLETLFNYPFASLPLPVIAPLFLLPWYSLL